MSAHRYSIKLPELGAAVSAVVYPAGAIINGDQAETTTPTVFTGHSFAAADKALGAGNRRAIDVNSVHTVSSITTTQLTLSSAAQFSDLSFLINMEADTGMERNDDGSFDIPRWDGSTVTIWKDPDKTNAYTNATVPIEGDGELVFYGDGSQFWVVLIDQGDRPIRVHAGVGPETPDSTDGIYVYSTTNYATKSYHVIRDGDDVQDVFDSVPVGDADAPTVVYAEPGQHSGVFYFYKNNTSLVGLGSEQCMFVKEAREGLGNNPGGFNIIDPDNLTTEVSNVRLENLCIVDQLSGNAVGGGGGSPEPALSIGQNTTSGQWDNIYVVNCLIIGNHDGMQLFGNDTSRGTCYIHGNRILSNHDALTVKCNGTVYSSNNVIVANDGGVHPMITGQSSPQDIINWKTTGLHVNCSSRTFDPALDRIFSSGDSIHVIGGAATLTAEVMAGIYVYETGGASACPLIRVVNPQIYVHWTEDDAASGDSVAGIMLDDTVTAAQGAFVVQGGSVEVLVDDNVSAPAEAIGIYNNVDAAAASYIRVIGTHVSCTARSGGSVNSAKTTNANANIELNIFSDDAVDGTTGVISAAPNITSE